MFGTQSNNKWDLWEPCEALLSHIPDSRSLVLEVLLPALVVVLMETEKGGLVRRMWMGVSVRAGREAARAGWSGPRVGDGAGPWAWARTLEERALRLSAGAAQGGVEVTVLAAERRGLERRAGRGRGEGGGKVVFGQPLGIDDGRGGRGSGGWLKVPQGAVLLDHATVLARPVRSLDNMRPLLLLLNFTLCVLHCVIFSVCCRAVATGCSCERVLAAADWRADVWRGTSVGTQRMVPSVAEGQRVTTCIAQGHGPLPAGLVRTLSLLWGTRRQQTERFRFCLSRLNATGGQSMWAVSLIILKQKSSCTFGFIKHCQSKALRLRVVFLLSC